jgi:hypothetical protein
MGWVVSVTPRLQLTPGKEPVPIVHEAGWASGPVWTGAENLASTGIRSPDLSARNESLYRLHYPGSTIIIIIIIIIVMPRLTKIIRSGSHSLAEIFVSRNVISRRFL